MTWALVLEHLFIVLAASILSITIGLPLGILAYACPKIRGLILRVVDILQTIPALALLGIIMVLLDPGTLHTMSQMAHTCARPDAASKVAQGVLALCRRS